MERVGDNTQASPSPVHGRIDSGVAAGLLAAQTVLARQCNVFAIATLAVACARTPPIPLPSPPERLSTYPTDVPDVPVVVGMPNAIVRTDGTPWNRDTTAVFRERMAVFLPNRLHEMFGKRQAFSQVVRMRDASSRPTDYVLHLAYAFSQRQALSLLPGAIANAHASVKGRLAVRLTDGRTGVDVFHHDYLDEHRDDTLGYTPAYVSYLQDEFLSQVMVDVIDAVAKAAGCPPPRR
jgi:hypothetical protein